MQLALVVGHSVRRGNEIFETRRRLASTQQQQQLGINDQPIVCWHESSSIQVATQLNLRLPNCSPPKFASPALTQTYVRNRTDSGCSLSSELLMSSSASLPTGNWWLLSLAQEARGSSELKWREKEFSNFQFHCCYLILFLSFSFFGSFWLTRARFPACLSACLSICLFVCSSSPVQLAHSIPMLKTTGIQQADNNELLARMSRVLRKDGRMDRQAGRQAAR